LGSTNFEWEITFDIVMRDFFFFKVNIHIFLSFFHKFKKFVWSFLLSRVHTKIDAIIFVFLLRSFFFFSFFWGHFFQISMASCEFAMWVHIFYFFYLFKTTSFAMWFHIFYFIYLFKITSLLIFKICKCWSVGGWAHFAFFFFSSWSVKVVHCKYSFKIINKFLRCPHSYIFLFLFCSWSVKVVFCDLKNKSWTSLQLPDLVFYLIFLYKIVPCFLLHLNLLLLKCKM
jgi:hypothetical protein